MITEQKWMESLGLSPLSSSGKLYSFSNMLRHIRTRIWTKRVDERTRAMGNCGFFVHPNFGT